MNSSQTGTWGELQAAAWLMSQGYEVFMGLGLTSCDLIALREGVLIRVEVKRACVKPKGDFMITVKRASDYDVLLIVLPDGTILDSEDARPICTGIPVRTG